MNARVLVAGIGNIFLSDDGFGVEVVQQLSSVAMPPDVVVADYGIRGMHLAYELLDQEYDTTILVDTISRDGEPGTLYLVEADPETCAGAEVDAHGMTPAAVLALLRQLGGEPGRVLVVGCEPECLDEGIGLSPPVTEAVGEAVRRVPELAEEESRTAMSRSERSESHVSRHPG